MSKTKPTEGVYPIEEEAQKLIREIRLSLRRASRYLFTIPKKKDERMIHLIEVTAWILFTIALILRAGGRM